MLLLQVTTCKFCNDKFQHATKLLYHMLHLHKANPVHFVSKHMRAKENRTAQPHPNYGSFEKSWKLRYRY